MCMYMPVLCVHIYTLCVCATCVRAELCLFVFASMLLCVAKNVFCVCVCLCWCLYVFVCACACIYIIESRVRFCMNDIVYMLK